MGLSCWLTASCVSVPPRSCPLCRTAFSEYPLAARPPRVASASDTPQQESSNHRLILCAPYPQGSPVLRHRKAAGSPPADLPNTPVSAFTSPEGQRFVRFDHRFRGRLVLAEEPDAVFPLLPHAVTDFL